MSVTCNGGVTEGGPTAALLLGVLTHHDAMGEAQGLRDTSGHVYIFMKYKMPETLRD